MLTYHIKFISHYILIYKSILMQNRRGTAIFEMASFYSTQSNIERYYKH